MGLLVGGPTHLSLYPWIPYLQISCRSLKFTYNSQISTHCIDFTVLCRLVQSSKVFEFSMLVPGRAQLGSVPPPHFSSHCEHVSYSLFLRATFFTFCNFCWWFCCLFCFFYKTMYVWLHWVFVAACGLSLVVSGGYSSLWCTGFSLRWLLLLRSLGSRRVGFSSCSMRAQ